MSLININANCFSWTEVGKLQISRQTYLRLYNRQLLERSSCFNRPSQLRWASNIS